MTQRAVVVGGGVIGLSSAWYLARAGIQVTVIDRAKIGAACSGGNCGLVCPSHVLPLTEPGALKEGFKALLSSRSPFRIRPRLAPQLWSWLWQFSRRCNHDSMLQAARAIQPLLSASMKEYQRWVGEEGVQCEWQARGLLFVYRTVKAWESYEETNRLLAERFNEPARRLNSEETASLEPALKEDIAGGWFYEHDAHLRPDKLISALKSKLLELGATLREDCELREVSGNAGRAHSVLTSQGSVEADFVLFCSGAWTPLLKEHLGVRVPIEPGKGYSITMPRPEICPKIPIIFPEHRVAVTPMESGYRLGSIMEFAGYDESISPERLELLREGAKHYLREPYGEPELQTWFGWRPMTYDSVPVIDRSPRWSNAWLATGHNMLGLSMAPATGKLLTELVLEHKPHLDPAPYQLARFG